MPTDLTTRAVEESTFIVTATFTDEDDDYVSPNSLTWTLTDGDGNIVNSREDVVVSSPSTSEDFVLTGDDLVVAGSSVRILTLEADYNSDAGSGLKLKDQVQFFIHNLPAVT